MRTIQKPEALSVIATIVTALVALLAVRSVFSFLIDHLFLVVVLALLIVAGLFVLVYKSRDEIGDE